MIQFNCDFSPVLDSGLLQRLVEKLEIQSPSCVRLSDAAFRLGTSKSALITILNDAGYTVKDRKNTWLTYDHVKILESNYLHSIKKLYKKVARPSFTVEERYFETFVNFFRRCIKNSNELSDVELFKNKLDDDLILEHFRNILFSCESQTELIESFRFVLRKLKFKLCRLFNDLRQFIFSILILNHYHIFSSEEDSSKALTSLSSFFEPLSALIERAVIKIKFIKAFSYEKNRHFNLQYTTE